MHHRRTRIHGLGHGRAGEPRRRACGSARAVAPRTRARCSTRPSPARTRSPAGTSNLTLTDRPVRVEHAERPDHAQLRRPVPDARRRQAARVQLHGQRSARSARAARWGSSRPARAGYVTLQGTSYQLPQATFQKLESSFAQLAAPPGASSGSGTLAKLGIHPLALAHPPDGRRHRDRRRRADHPHPRRGQRRRAARRSEHVLAKASSLGVSGAAKLKSGISPRDPQQDRRRGPESERRRVDRDQRQDRPPAHDRADAAGDRPDRRLELGGVTLGRHRADHAVREPQPAADDHRADHRAAVQRVPDQGADAFMQACRARPRGRSGAAGRRAAAASTTSGGREHRRGTRLRLVLERRRTTASASSAARRRHQDAEVRVAARQRRLAPDRLLAPDSSCSSSNSSGVLVGVRRRRRAGA